MTGKGKTELTEKLPAKALLTPELLGLLRKRQFEVSATAQAKFRDSVRAIYGAKLNSRPTHLGSATLVEINSVKVLLTAAHIVDENKLTTLYLSAGDSLSIIDGKFTITEAPNGRTKDHYDFAFYRLTEALAEKLEGSHFISLQDLSVASAQPQGTLFTALGFPNSKNRKYNPKKMTVKPTLFPYSSVHVLDPDIAKGLPNNGDDHLFITYGKKSRDEEGNVDNSVAPKGMSGGLIVDAGRPGDLEVLAGTKVPTPFAAGIVIELKKKKVLLGVRMSVIVPLLLDAFPAIPDAPANIGLDDSRRD